MSDRWYYADKERPVGPFTPRELKSVLQRLPSWKEVLIWKEEYSEWRKAGSVSDLDHVGAPPPIPPTPAFPNQSPNERTASSKGRMGPSRNTVPLVIGSYFLAALALAVFLEMWKPFAKWENLFDAYPLGSTIRAAVGLFVASGLVPVVVWQGNQLIDFHGMRIDRASGHPALVTEYRRTGSKGPVIVQINQIFTGAQEIGINLSYRETEAALWKPVVGKIRQSIVVRQWP